MPKDPAGRQEVRPLRLFVAVEIPEDAKDEAWDAVAPWKERFPDARWVPRENWHVTLKFLGSTRPPLTEWVPERVAAVARESVAFDARLVGLGAFPSPRRARVLWAGVEDGAAMTRIAGALEAALAREFKPEVRPFRPHLTVARSEPPLVMPEEFGETVLDGGRFPVNALTLFRSHLRRPAPTYERLATFPLGG
jgi:2'-5' RNA ligase